MPRGPPPPPAPTHSRPNSTLHEKVGVEPGDDASAHVQWCTINQLSLSRIDMCNLLIAAAFITFLAIIISFWFQLHSCFPCEDTTSLLLAKLAWRKLSPVTLISCLLHAVRMYCTCTCTCTLTPCMSTYSRKSCLLSSSNADTSFCRAPMSSSGGWSTVKTETTLRTGETNWDRGRDYAASVV